LYQASMLLLFAQFFVASYGGGKKTKAA